jgi:putative heme-binding domain-containing protein
MGAQFGPRELAESILWPSRVVREGYQAVLVELKDGEEVAGLIKGESPEVLTLRDSAGRLRQVAKTEVVSRRQSDQSLMPEGLQAGLSLQEFADLLAFAARCRSSP